MLSINQARNYVEQQKGRRAKVIEDYNACKESIKTLTRDLHRHEQTKEIIRIVGVNTQNQLAYHISDITSLALSSVYDNPYVVIAEFLPRRGKTECDLYFKRGEDRIDPMDASGGGTVNIASFALRIAAWSMQRPRSRNVIILDEPFGNVSTDLLPRASKMLQSISRKLGLQIIMVTHSEELQEAADKTFQVTIHKGVSHVEEV